MSFRNLFRRRGRPTAEDIASVALLDDPVRAVLFFHVSSSGAEVTRDDAAAAAGVTRRIAAFHLDRLVEDGLLEASFRRLSGKTGPGAGRPSKLYRRSTKRFSVSLPPRNYELMARVLASAVEGSKGASAVEILQPGARDFGVSLGAAAKDHAGPGASRERRLEALTRELEEEGFEPFLDGRDTVRLRNCPYHEMARENTDMVCSLNLALMQGIADGLVLDDLQPSLEPGEGRCCVAFHITPGSVD